MVRHRWLGAFRGRLHRGPRIGVVLPAAVLLAAALLSSCVSVPTDPVDTSVAPSDAAVDDERVCLVLSIGTQRGLAQIGAIQALEELGERPECVFGTSVGSIVGAVYAYAPDEPIDLHGEDLVHTYAAATRRVAVGRAVCAGVTTWMLTGGLALPLAIGGAAAVTTPGADLERLHESLDRHLHGAGFSDLEIEFATAYKQHLGETVETVIATDGCVADAVACSVNNPFTFRDTDMSRFDAGADRMLAVPIQDAYELFHPDRIIAINTTGHPAVYMPDIACEITEIVVPFDSEMLEVGRVITERGRRALYDRGYQAVMGALGHKAAGQGR